MAYLATEKANRKYRKHLAKYTLGCIKFAVSVMLIPGWVLLIGNMSSEGGVPIPLIKAAEESWWRIPDDPGGNVTKKSGFSVNALLAGNRASETVGQIKLADPSADLHGDDLSPREYTQHQLTQIAVLWQIGPADSVPETTANDVKNIVNMGSVDRTRKVPLYQMAAGFDRVDVFPVPPTAAHDQIFSSCDDVSGIDIECR
ncbi:MAG: hypothetical protein OXD33_00190 [Rhodobacteraceae bacterium]|nr:hypothetical protein [Paracoccaceae bacterium]